MLQTGIKILHVLDSLAVGGMERVVIDVATGLNSARFLQTVCCLSRRGEAAHLLPPEVVCLDLGKGAQADRLMPLKLARLIREQKPDIVHTQSWSGIDTGLALALLKAVGCAPRLVHSEHGRNLPYLDGEPRPRRFARRALYQLADAVFAVSGEVGDHYCRETGFARDRMQVIPNGIDLRRIDAADAGSVRAELGLDEGDFVIGTVARLDATKDTMTLARAFAEMQRNEGAPDAKLLLVGDGAERARLEAFVAERGLQRSVVFAGTRHDVPRLLRAMDVFALSSLSEGLPITVLEAMAARLPVVATGVGALPELIEEGGTGFLVAPRDAGAMAESLRRLYADRALADRFGARGRQRVERDYGIEQMLGRYTELYLSVLGRND